MPIYFRSVNGKIEFYSKESMVVFQKIMDSFNNTGRLLELNIIEYSPIVTEQQQALFRALLIAGAEQTGYTYEEFESLLIDEFAPFRYEKSILGDFLKTKKSVSEMTNREFKIFLEQSVMFANDFFNLNFIL